MLLYTLTHVYDYILPRDNQVELSVQSHHRYGVLLWVRTLRKLGNIIFLRSGQLNMRPTHYASVLVFSVQSCR